MKGPDPYLPIIKSHISPARLGVVYGMDAPVRPALEMCPADSVVDKGCHYPSLPTLGLNFPLTHISICPIA